MKTLYYNLKKYDRTNLQTILNGVLYSSVISIIYYSVWSIFAESLPVWVLPVGTALLTVVFYISNWRNWWKSTPESETTDLDSMFFEPVIAYHKPYAHVYWEYDPDAEMYSVTYRYAVFPGYADEPAIGTMIMSTDAESIRKAFTGEPGYEPVKSMFFEQARAVMVAEVFGEIIDIDE